METSLSQDVRELFKFYKTTVFSFCNDLQFWKDFLDAMINNYNEDNGERKLYESIFGVYDLPHNNESGYLKTYKEIFDISTSNLADYRKNFFSWIMNLSILKSYNTSELFLLRTIQLKFYPLFENPLEHKKHADKIHKVIRQFLVEYDSKNNRHIIQFLKQKSNFFKEFAGQKIRVDLKADWEQFFEFISILRNIVAHHGSIVHKDTYNHLKSIDAKFLERYFELINSNGHNILRAREDYFLDFINYVNDFSINTAKFVFEKKDLSFLDMY